MSQVFIFGDSIVYGAHDKEGGWVSRLRKFLDEKTFRNPDMWYFVYNLGVSGNTTEDLLDRFEFETKERFKDAAKDEELILIFGIGGNDSAFMHNKKEPWVLPEKFKENLGKLTELAQKFSSEIVFVGLSPIDQSKTDPVPWATNISYLEENTQEYDDIIKTFCKEEGIHFVEVYKELIKKDPTNLLEDGVHPNSEGHREIFGLVKSFLIEKGII